MMNLADPSMALLASSGGDTIKLFDVSRENGDSCTLCYTPSPGCLVNSVKWNHTNLVVASAGEDKKISLWRKNGESMGPIPPMGINIGDNIEETILSISFSNKSSRYICSGGTGQVVRIWDLQRQRCIKWLKGHVNTITGAMYNLKDEHLASISVTGHLIVHNLASGARATELKDPSQQVLRVLDYSRISRHLLVTSGDDGTVSLWDTTGRNPKVSWLKQHSAPTAGVSFSPSNDKVIASVGLDKKLYTYDSGSRRPSSCIAYEAPFSSLAFRDDGWVLAAGTSTGRVVFYDVRGKPQPVTTFHAYGNSEAVSSLCWQRSKPVIVDENTCIAEMALLGGATEDSVLMPDPLPTMTSSSLSQASIVSGSRIVGRAGASFEATSIAATSIGTSSGILKLSSEEKTPQSNHLWHGETLTRLHAPRLRHNLKDDMEVFSPLVDVQPITPSLDKMWDATDTDGTKKDYLLDKKPISFMFPSSNRRFLFANDGAQNHPIFDWKSSSTSVQDDTRSSSTALGSTLTPYSKREDAAITPPEAWGGEKLSDKFTRLRRLPSRLGMPTLSSMTSESMFSGLHDYSSSQSQTSMNLPTNTNMNYENLRTRDISSNLHTSSEYSEHIRPSSISYSLDTTAIAGPLNLSSPKLSPLGLPGRLSTYAERMSTASAFSDGASSPLVGSPKIKKTGAETKEELLNSLLLRSDTSAGTEQGFLPVVNVGTSQPVKTQSDHQQGSNFTLQLFQRTLEETLDSFQNSVHEDMRNLHIEILRQFHMQEMEMSSVLSLILENQSELMKEVKSLRHENQQLRQML